MVVDLSTVLAVQSTIVRSNERLRQKIGRTDTDLRNDSAKPEV
ncbi:MAG: hypothetical protein OXN89_02660 [Bryobacterales bacterium]|nr:hypothetical protein [Bryobacterales bacterium]